MKITQITLILIFPLVFTNCLGVSEDATLLDDNKHEAESVNELMSELTDGAEGETWSDYFDLDVPEPMMEMNSLNPEAIAQYGYIAEKIDEDNDTTILEHYLVVVMQAKSEIKGYPVELKLDAMSYRNDVINSLRGSKSLDEFQILTDEPIVEKVGGIDCVKNELLAAVNTANGPAKLYYNLGIFEGEKAFYQVMTWCLDSQKETFKKDMSLIIDSFKEK